MRRLAWYAATLAFLLGTGAVASAQEVWLAGTQMRTNSGRLGDPRGIIGGVGFRRSPMMTWRLTYNHLNHDQRRMGLFCPNIGVPCTEEPVDDEVTLRGGALSVVTTVARRGGIGLALVPGIGIYRARSVSEGVQTGTRTTETRSMLGFGLGAELSLSSRAAWPVALHVGAHAGILSALGSTPTGFYTPFSGEPRLMRFDAGVSVGWRRRAR